MGYELHFNNFTGKTLIIASKKRAGITEKYYQIIKPGKSVIQAWHDAHCLESLQWAELNPNYPLHGGLDLIDNNRGGQIPPDKQKKFDETFFSKTSGKGLYLWNNLKIIFVPNEIFEQTKKAAVQLVKGFDKMICQATTASLLELTDSVLALLKKTLTSLEDQLSQTLKEKAEDLKQALNLDKLSDAYGTKIDSLQKKISETKDKIEKYIKEKVGGVLNSNTCFSNLTQVAKAAGKIHGISICKNREFMIFDSGEKDDLTGMPLLLAETVEGQ